MRKSARARLKGARPPALTAVGAGTGSMTNIGLTIVQRALLSGENLSANLGGKSLAGGNDATLANDHGSSLASILSFRV